jgi:hypothetical protein
MPPTTYSILTGVGRLYVANVGLAFPAINAVPGAGWTDLGETLDGVKLSMDQKNIIARTDQRTGGIKAARDEEGVSLETKLAEGTMENLAKLLGQTMGTVAAAAGVPGQKYVYLHRGVTVVEYAFLFRGFSPDGPWNEQYELPRGFFDDAVEVEYKRADQATFSAKFIALEDLNAATELERFGRRVGQSAEPL